MTDRWPIQAVFWPEWGSSIAGRILLWLAEQEVNILGVFARTILLKYRHHTQNPAKIYDFGNCKATGGWATLTRNYNAGVFER